MKVSKVKTNKLQQLKTVETMTETIETMMGNTKTILLTLYNLTLRSKEVNEQPNNKTEAL